MPKPRQTSSKVTAFQVMPWQIKQKKPKEGVGQPQDLFEDLDEEGEGQPDQPTLLQPELTHTEPDASQSPTGLHKVEVMHSSMPWQSKQKRHGTPQGMQTPHTEGDTSPQPSEQQDLPFSSPDQDSMQPASPAGPEATLQGGGGVANPPTEAELARLCDFDDDDVVPAPTAPGRKTWMGRGPQAAAPRPSSRPALGPAPGAAPGAQQGSTRAPGPAAGAATAGPMPDASADGMAPAVDAAPALMTALEGTCRLAVLPGRTGWSGHCVDKATRTCVGVMAVQVGSASSSGHTCGVDDDEEIYKVTLIQQLGTARQREQQAYVVSVGGDLPRWRPAEAMQLVRAGLGPEDEQEEEEEEEEVVVAPEGDRRARQRDGATIAESQMQVIMEASRLLSDSEAEAQLAVFARKLQRMGVSVVLGDMRVSGLCAAR